MQPGWLGVTLVLACGTSAKEPPPPPPPPVVGALVLGEATVYEGERAIWRLHANGNSEFFDDAGRAWRAAETFGADGSVTFLDKLVFRITETAITGPDATPQLVAIAGNTLTVPVREEPDGEPAQVPIVLVPDGKITVQREPAGPAVVRWRIEAASAPVMRTAFLAFGTTIMPRIRRAVGP